MSLIKTQLQGSYSWLPLCVHPFASMQTCSSPRRKQNSTARVRALNFFFFPPSLKLFSWLVSPPLSGLGGLRGIMMEIFRNYLWHHHPYQWSLGKGQTKKTILKSCNTSSYVVPREAFCRANMHEVTRQTLSADNHLARAQSSWISKLKIGR